MYRIVKQDGTTIAVTEKIRYIKISNNGCYVQAEKNDAVGIAYSNTPYNLLGHSDIKNADTVFVQEFDSGKYLREGNAPVTWDDLAAAYTEGVNSIDE